MNDLSNPNRKFFFISNLISLLNFFCGFVSILMVARGALCFGAWLIFLALILDSLDGNIARIFHNTTALGRELDSLADLASFVMAPAFLVSTFLGYGLSHAALGIVFLYLACGVFRLARFNIQEPIDGHFNGLPTPAASTLISMTVLACLRHSWGHHEILAGLLLLSSGLMISPIRYPKLSVLPVSRWRFFLLVEMVIGIAMLTFLDLESAFASVILGYAVFAPVLERKT